jgi:hypothetical protein
LTAESVRKRSNQELQQFSSIVMALFMPPLRTYDHFPIEFICGKCQLGNMRSGIKRGAARTYAAVYADRRRNTKRVLKQEKGKTPMTLSFVGHAMLIQARDQRVFRPPFTRAVNAIAPVIKEGCKVVFVLASLLTAMIALAALDVWIWVPRFIN